MFEAGQSDPSSLEPVCGSPTIIGCAEPSSEGLEHQEVNKQSSEQSLPVSGVLPQASSGGEDFESNRSNTRDHKETNASDERTFTFEVGSTTAISEKSPVSGWKPFSIMESYEAPQVRFHCLLGTLAFFSNCGVKFFLTSIYFVDCAGVYVMSSLG